MRHALLAAYLWIGAGCTVGSGGMGPGTPPSTPDESGCFSQSSLPLEHSWVLTWGGGLADETYDIATSSDGVILMGGYFAPAVFRGPDGKAIQAPATTTAAPASGRRGFIARVDALGHFVWSADIPTRRVNIEPHVATAPDGSVYAVGLFEAPFDFDPSAGVDIQDASFTAVNGYITKLSADGTYQWTRTWTAKPASVGSWFEPYVVVAADGSAFVVDRYATPDVHKFAPDGTHVVTQTSGHEIVTAAAIGADGSLLLGYIDAASAGIARYDAATIGVIDTQVIAGRPWIAGISEVGDGRRVIGGTVSSNNGDAFVASYSTTDGAQQWMNTWGARGEDKIWKLTRTADGAVLVGGEYYKTIDFDPTPDGVDERTSRREDAVLVEYGADGAYRGVRTWGGTAQDYAFTLAVTTSGRVLVGGMMGSSINFGSSIADVRVDAGHDDGYVLALDPVITAAASGTACLPAAVQSPTNTRLDGTSLPKTFEECAALDPQSVLYGREGDGRCWFTADEITNPSQFAECRDAGGGLSVVDGDISYEICDIIYDEVAGACFGNFCD